MIELFALVFVPFDTHDVGGIFPLLGLKLGPSSGTYGHKECRDLLVFYNERGHEVVRGEELVLVALCQGRC